MPLVSMTEMLKKAKAEGYAVGQFNLNNLEFYSSDFTSGGRRKITGYFRCF